MRERRSLVKREFERDDVGTTDIGFESSVQALSRHRSRSSSSGHSGGLNQFVQLALLSVVVALILPRVMARPHRSLKIASAAALVITTQRFCSIAIN
jgi:hypothetical protein